MAQRSKKLMSSGLQGSGLHGGPWIWLWRVMVGTVHRVMPATRTAMSGPSHSWYGVPAGWTACAADGTGASAIAATSGRTRRGVDEGGRIFVRPADRPERPYKISASA